MQPPRTKLINTPFMILQYLQMPDAFHGIKMVRLFMVSKNPNMFAYHIYQWLACILKRGKKQ